jgi:hypothetical protein
MDGRVLEIGTWSNWIINAFTYADINTDIVVSN